MLKLYNNILKLRIYQVPTRNCAFNRYKGRPPEDKTLVESLIEWRDIIVSGKTRIPAEFRKLKQEVREYFTSDIPLYYDGDKIMLWKFDNKETVNKWITTADSDNKEGFSKCDFVFGPNKTGIFSGVLNTQVPKDGQIMRSGYCSVQSERKMLSFGRETYMDWTFFTHVVVNVRGDGRTYMMNIVVDHNIDISWYTVFSFPLYTRGGPYWQLTKVPLSKFYKVYKGRVQDKQDSLPTDKIRRFGFTCADSIDGPFRLEVKSIEIMYDPTHREDHAYETYELPENFGQ